MLLKVLYVGAVHVQQRAAENILFQIPGNICIEFS